MTVTTGTRTSAEKAYQQLQKLLPGVALATDKHSPPPGMRVVVGTFMRWPIQTPRSKSEGLTGRLSYSGRFHRRELASTGIC
jgi:hypothetical protein